MKQYPKYKDSGVSWIGEIPEGWETLKLKFLCSYFQAGSNLTSFQIKPEGTYSVYGGNGIRGYFDEYNWDGGCNLIGRQGALCGNVHLVKDKFWATEHAIIIKANEKSSDDFLFYLMTAMNLNQYASQTAAQPGLAVDRIKQVKACCPPLPEQHAIVSYLDKKTAQIDRFISEAEREIEKLNELKQAQIAHLVTHGTNTDAPMKDSGIAWIGQIPEHWEVKRIALLFAENKVKNDDYEFDHALKFNYGSLVPKDEKGDVTELKDTYIAYTKIKQNDIAINCLNLNYDFVSQRVAICPQNSILTSAYLIMTPREGVNAQFYNFLFKAMDGKKLFHGMGTGIRLTLSYSELKKQYVVVPPVEEQQTIVSAINNLNQKTDMLTSSLTHQIEHLKELKQRIISDAVTGKIDVREVNN